MVVETKESKLSLDNTSPEDIPHLEQKLRSSPEFTPQKVVQLQKDTFCNHILKYMCCNMNKKYFTNAMGILHTKKT